MIALLAVVMMAGMVSADTMEDVAAGTTPSVDATVALTFENQPALCFKVTEDGDNTDTITGVDVTVTTTGGAAPTDFSFIAWHDVDENGIVNKGDVQLCAPVAGTGASATKTTITFTSVVNLAQSASEDILITASGTAADGETVALTIANNGDVKLGTGTTTGTIAVAQATLTCSSTAPDNTVSAGTTQVAARTVATHGQNDPVFDLKVTNAAATADRIKSVKLTTAYVGAERSDISNVQMYIDADGSGTVSDGDTELWITPTTFGADAETFTITGGVAVPGIGNVELLAVYDFAGTAVESETITTGLADGNDVVMVTDQDDATAAINGNPMTFTAGVTPFTLTIVTTPSEPKLDDQVTVTATILDAGSNPVSDWPVTIDGVVTDTASNGKAVRIYTPGALGVKQVTALNGRGATLTKTYSVTNNVLVDVTVTQSDGSPLPALEWGDSLYFKVNALYNGNPVPTPGGADGTGVPNVDVYFIRPQ